MNHKHIYVTSDTHFLHSNINKLCGRPEKFEDLIEEDWRKKVNKNDMVIHVGDITHRVNPMVVHDRWIKNLPGMKILVRGNHDRESTDWYLNNGWDFVCESFQVIFRGTLCEFSHRPKYKPLEVERLDKQDLPNHIHICGHLHENAKNYSDHPVQYVVSLEIQGYKLQTLDSIVSRMNAARRKYIES